MNQRRGSISLFASPPIPTPRVSITEEPNEIKGIKSIKDDLQNIHDELDKIKAVKCKCKCNDIESRLMKQIDLLKKSLKELIEN
jgi:hypothetical protein